MTVMTVDTQMTVVTPMTVGMPCHGVIGYLGVTYVISVIGFYTKKRSIE
jgi:hypothetical protein